MDDKTRDALEGSIAKWQAIVNGTGRDEGTDNCPLCQMFYTEQTRQEGISCIVCPVYFKTGFRYCRGSPYIAYSDYIEERYPGDMDYDETEDPRAIALAQEELDFLMGLRP